MQRTYIYVICGLEQLQTIENKLVDAWNRLKQEVDRVPLGAKAGHAPCSHKDFG